MSDPETIRAGLRAAAEARARADADKRAATDDLVALLTVAYWQRLMPLSEAAKLAGISRNSAYRMLGLQ